MFTGVHAESSQCIELVPASGSLSDTLDLRGKQFVLTDRLLLSVTLSVLSFGVTLRTIVLQDRFLCRNRL
jgi:hypothetical protein